MGICVRGVRGWVASCLILGGILVGAGGGTVLSTGAAVAQTVNSIVVEGNRRVEADTIRSYFRPGPGGRLGPEQEDEALKALVATGLFSDVRISHSGGRIVVTVAENPVINRVAFEGNKKAKDEQLLAETQSKPRGTLSRPTVQADVQRIIEIYHRSGRFDVSVTPKIIELPNNRVDLVFEIKEGDKTGIKELVFVGAKAFSHGRLKDVIKTSSSNLLSFLQTTDIYDRRPHRGRPRPAAQLLSEARLCGCADRFCGRRIRRRQEGLHRHFHDRRRQPVSRRDRRCRVERPRDRPGNLAQSGQAQPGQRLQRGSRRKERRIDDDPGGASRAMPLPMFGRAATAISRPKRSIWRFVVEEGARAYIERINIRGNTRTRDYVIRREFDLGEGDAYNRALIDRAERRLKNLNYFKSVKITNEPGSAPDRVVINVDVEEQATGEFSVSGGYSTADGLIGEVSVADRNLMGRGNYGKGVIHLWPARSRF